MSSCEAEVARLADAVRVLRTASADAAPGAISQDVLCDLLAEVVRLYCGQSADPYGDVAMAGLQTTPTEACTVAAALLHAQSLTPFEFSIWFSGGRAGRHVREG